MLFREEFIDRCLKAVAKPDLPAEHRCAICFEAPTNPVTVCHHEQHIFCSGCIVRWFQTPRGNKCPLCKTVLFHPAHTAVHRLDDSSVLERLNRARQLAPTYPGSPPTAATDDQGQNPYDAGVSYLDRREGYSPNGALTLRAIVPDATAAVEEVSGAGRIPPANRMRLHLNAMAFLIRAYAHTVRLSYTQQDVNEWNEIVALTGSLLCSNPGTRIRNVRYFRENLLETVTRSWVKKNGRFAVRPACLGWERSFDMTLLLDYVVVLSWEEAKTEGPVERIQRRTCQLM